MNSNLTEIALIVDCSGSMTDCQTDTKGMLKSFLEKQKQEPGELKLTYVLFSSTVRTVLDGVNIQSVDNLEYHIHGNTALYDAIGMTMNQIGTRLDKTPENERPAKVLICILTDGQENSSREFSYQQIKAMINHQKEKYNWDFVFMGADITADQGIDIGVDATNAYTFSKGKMDVNINLFNTKFSNYRSSEVHTKGSMLCVTEEERKSVV